VFIRGIAYRLGEPVSISSVPELAKDGSALEDLLALGLERCAIASGSSADLLGESVAATLRGAAIDPSTVDAVVYASNGLRDAAVPAIKAVLRSLGLGRAYPYGVTLSACGNLQAALTLGALLVSSGQAGRVLVATADKNSEYGPESRIYSANVTVYSDGAASCILDAEPSALELVEVGQHSDGAVAELQQQGGALSALLKHTVGGIVKTVQGVMSRSQISMASVQRLYMNNYNRSVLRVFGLQLGVRPERVFSDNIARFAHAYAADTLINLHDDLAVRTPAAGELLLLIGTGPDTWGATLLRAHEPRAERV
jgi:3-oxoacyl-[acyl-carrier-protein] synthase III